MCSSPRGPLVPPYAHQAGTCPSIGLAWLPGMAGMVCDVKRVYYSTFLLSQSQTTILDTVRCGAVEGAPMCHAPAFRRPSSSLTTRTLCPSPPRPPPLVVSNLGPSSDHDSLQGSLSAPPVDSGPCSPSHIRLAVLLRPLVL